MFRNLPDIPLKTSQDVLSMRKSGRIAEQTLAYLRSFIQPGVSTSELACLAESFIREHGAVPVLKGYKGFPAAICTSVNQVAAHGIPGRGILQQGDVLSIDVTVAVDGWHGDAAWTYPVGKSDKDIMRLIKAAWHACMAGVLACRAGRNIGDIGYYIKKTARKFNCTVLEDFGGHGIGRAMHEDPIIPNFGTKGGGLPIVPGMVFTVEPMLSLGKTGAVVEEDGWTISTCDGAFSAQFEHTIAVFKDRIEILTFSEKNLKKCIDYSERFW